MTIHFGRVEWFGKYNLGWSDSVFTLDDWLKSDNDPEWLASKWVQNYVYNTLTLSNILDRMDYWKRILIGKTTGWKWLYSKKYRLT